jgi:hypothetical protein
MMREINRYIPTFKDILGKNGKSEAIAWLQKKINETTDPLSAVSKRVLYNDQSGFSVTGTVSDFLKGNSVNAEEYIRNLVNNRYGKETNPLKAQYMAMRDAVSELKGLSITGKDSDVSSMIFNRVNVQDFSAFGRMIQPLRSNMTQHQNYYALKKTAINGMAATYTRLTTTGSAEKAMGTIGRHLSGITARGTIANNIEIQNAINAALNDPTVPKHVKDELMNKRSMLSTYENMSIMSQDLADTLGSQYTRYLPVDAKFKEQAEKLIGQSFKPDEVMIRDPRAKNNLHYKGEYGTTATVSELVAQADGSYKLRLDVAKPFMSGGKFTSMAGEKATATILSREAYQAIDKSGGLYMFSPNIPKHGDIGAFIEGLVGNKLYDLNMTSGEKAIRQFASQLNALMYSGAREKMAKEAIEVEHVDGFFRFNIAEDAILKGQGSLLDENAKKLSQLLLRGKGSINVMSEVRAAKVDETFAIHGPYSKDGVKYSFREVLALRAQNLGAVADYVQGEFGVNSGATSSRLSNAWKAAQDVSGVKRITDSLPEFAIGNGIEDVVRDTGIVSYKNSIFKPTGMASDQLYKLNLPVALEASDFLGWGSNHPEGKLTLAKAFEKGNMTGIDSLTVLTSDLGKYHPMVNGQQVTRYSIGGDDSITNALADVERSIMSINDLAADATDDVRRDARRRLAYSVNKYAEAASYAVSGSHGETKDAFTANLKRSAYVKLQGINPTEFTRSGSALWEAGVRENTVVISKELAGQMMGRSYVHDLTKGASLVNGIYQTEELYGLGLRYPNINRQSVQGLRVMIGDAETLGLNTKAAYMTPGTVKKLAGDFDGDNVTISMLLDEENTKGARQAVERMWQATYAKESQDQLKEYYNNKIGSKLGMTSAREGLADIISGGAIRDIDSLTTETVLNSKIGAKMFTGYVTNTATRMMSSAASIYGVTSDQYRLLEDTISTPLQQDIISSKHGTNTIMSVFEVIDTINGRSNNYGQLRNALIDPAKASEEDIAKIDRGINILRDIHTKTARTHSLNVATSSTGEKALSSLLGSGTLLDDELAETVLGKIDTTAERAKLLRDQMNEEAYQSIMNEMKDTYSKVEEHTQFNLKFNKKTAIVAAGVAAGLYAFGTVRGMLDVGDARMQPEEDKAPASDGYYIPGGGETHRAPIAPISMMGSGYEGMQINIKAYNSKGGTDPEYLNEAIASSMKNQIAVPVTIKHSVSDNRSDMNKQDVEGILSQAIRGY